MKNKIKKTKNKKNKKLPEEITTTSKVIGYAILGVILLIILTPLAVKIRTNEIAEESESGKLSEAKSYYDVGMNYYRQNNLSLAIPNFQKAIKLAPDFAAPYTNLAISFAKLNEKEKGLQLLKTVLKKNPSEPYLVYFNLAQMYKNDDRVEAEKAYKKTIELHPFPQDVCFEFGDFYWNNKNYEAAAKYLEKGLQLQNLKDYYLGAIKRGIYLYAAEPKVIEFLKNELKKNISDEFLSKFDDTVFQKYYLENNPKFARLCDQLGYYYNNFQQNPEKAKEYFKKSIKFWNSKNNQAYQHLKYISASPLNITD